MSYERLDGTNTAEHPTWLRLAHKQLNHAVLDAYGWPHEVSDKQIPSRLLAHKGERAAGQGGATFHSHPIMNRDTVTQQILATWADELNAKLGRPTEAILRRGLSALDFRGNEDLKLTLPDGSSAYFRYAFFVVSPSRRQIAVFTEHCGYHIFPASGTTVERIIREWFAEE